MTADQQALKSALDSFEAALKGVDADAIAATREDVEMAALFGKSTVFAEQGVDLLSAIMKIAGKQVPDAAIKEYAPAAIPARNYAMGKGHLEALAEKDARDEELVAGMRV